MDHVLDLREKELETVALLAGFDAFGLEGSLETHIHLHAVQLGGFALPVAQFDFLALVVLVVLVVLVTLFGFLFFVE